MFSDPSSLTSDLRVYRDDKDEHYWDVLALENGNQSLTMRETRSAYSSKSLGF
jgi:hypothetical protein